MTEPTSQPAPHEPLKHLSGYGLAVTTTALAAFARWLWPWALTPAPYLGFYPAVVVSAALGGVGPGLVATFASLLLVNVVFGTFNIHDHGAMARQVIWVVASVGVSLLAGLQRSASLRVRRQAGELRRWNEDLEARVRQRTAEIQEANRRLRDANEKLAELDHAKTAFFSNVSHEFRTPLTLMLGPLEETLARTDGPTPADRNALVVVHRNALRLLRLVNTLLDFARIEAGRIQALYEPTDLALLTAELASNFHSAIERAGLTLTVDCPPLPQPVYVDRDMWEKIVLNLLSNAFKFTFEGGITVRLALHDRMAELSIADTGTGIESHELPRLFERFRRIRGAKGRTFEGSGIGLALVAELVKLHAGRVSAESTFGSGSTFTVRLPLGKDHLPPDRIGTGRTLAPTAMGAAPFVEEALRWLPDEAARPTPALDEATPGHPPRPRNTQAQTPSRPRVLLADDNADMRRYLARLLEGAYTVEAVADGNAALAAALADPPDLVLSDVMMPGLDGFALLHAMRNEPGTTAVPFILLSGRAGEESRVEGMEAGADDYLTKPFGARELLARVKAHLELARARQHASHMEAQFKAEARVAETLREQAGHLRQANEELERFAYISAHDLQEPMRQVRAFVQMLKDRYGNTLDGKAAEYFGYVYEGAGRMSDMVQGLLEYSRVRSDDMKREPVSPNAAVQTALENLKTRLDEAQCLVTCDDLPAVKADLAMLVQLFQNLISNAVTYRRADVPPAIHVGFRDDGNETEFFVRDNGIGIAPQYHERIFQIFQRLHTRDKYPGTGIGLAICRKIIERHGGRIWVESTPAEGSVFHFTLPPSG
jgi:signal transduction histidine kinase